jgi:hypothetical protein
MGATKIWWYPDPAGSIEAITLASTPRLTEFEEIPDPEWDGASDLAGGESRAFLRGRQRFRLTFERFADASIERALRTLQVHLESGGGIGFALDASKAWCGFARNTPSRGRTAINTNGNVFEYKSGAALAAADEIVIQAPNPNAQREVTTVSSVSGNDITLTDTLRYTYTTSPLIRYRYFIPWGKMPDSEKGRSIVTWDRRLWYTMDLTLVEDLADIFALSTHAGSAIVGETSTGTQTMTIPQILNVSRPGSAAGYTPGL